MTKSNNRGKKNSPHTADVDGPSGRRDDDRDQRCDSEANLQKTHPRSNADARTGGCAGEGTRPVGPITRQPDNGADVGRDPLSGAQQATQRECIDCGATFFDPKEGMVQTRCPDCRPLTDGGVDVVDGCTHANTRRVGTVDDDGNAVLEERCRDCGQPVATEGSR